MKSCSSGFIQDFLNQCQILMDNFSLIFHKIDFKPWHNDPYVLKFYAMTLLRIHTCSYGFIQDFLDHYVDGCRSNDVNVGTSPMNEF